LTVDGSRYALYFSPSPTGRWWSTWSAWLGRCAATGRRISQPRIDGLDADMFAALTADPRRYGWHATLKAPFRLAAGSNLHALETAVAGIAARYPAFVCPPMSVVRLDNFMALVPSAESEIIKEIAAACVIEPDRLRAPPTDDELQRRRRAALSARQEEHLLRWGYPYVLDEFRFHFSLTGALLSQPQTTIQSIARAAELQLSALADDAHVFDAISLFVEPTPGADFHILRRFPLRASAHEITPLATSAERC
jgi:putative phosphonate metabolism protein